MEISAAIRRLRGLALFIGLLRIGTHQIYRHIPRQLLTSWIQIECTLARKTRRSCCQTACLCRRSPSLPPDGVALSLPSIIAEDTPNGPRVEQVDLTMADNALTVFYHKGVRKNKEVQREFRVRLRSGHDYRPANGVLEQGGECSPYRQEPSGIPGPRRPSIRASRRGTPCRG
jgi:hypothetical protein